MAKASIKSKVKVEAKGIERMRAVAKSRENVKAEVRDEDDMIKQVWRAKSLGAETRGVKPETKSAVSEDQARAKAETDIESIVKRKRAASTAKIKANS